MKIAFYKGFDGRWLDRVICFFSMSRYSHVELVFEDGYCASASPRDGGVRFKKININNGRWDIYELESSIDEQSVRKWFGKHINNNYDFKGAIFGAVFEINVRTKYKKYCSYACAMAIGVKPNLTPGKLYKILQDSGRIK